MTTVRVGMACKAGAALLATIAWSTALAAPAGARVDRIAFTYSAVDGNPSGIFSIRPDGNGLRRLAHGVAQGLEWSPDRTKLAFWRQSCPTRNDCRARIYVLDPDGPSVSRFAGGVDDISDLEWSPDGESIAFTGFQSGEDFHDLYIATAGERRARRFTETPDRLESSPDWSPDGTKIVFSAWTEGPPEGPRRRIFTRSVADGEEALLTEEGQFNIFPVWSPDGTKIAFVTSRDDRTEGEEAPYTNQLYVMDADGSDPRRVSSDEGTMKFDPHWSSDSMRLVWHEECDMDHCSDDSDVWAALVDGGDAVNLTEGPHRFDESPQWSRDGRRIVFLRWRRTSARTGIYSVRATGGVVREVVDRRGPENSIAWQSW